MSDNSTPPEDPAAEAHPEQELDQEPHQEPDQEDGLDSPHLSEYAQPGIEVQPQSAEPRRYPSTIGGLVYLAALGACITGLVIVSRGHWQLGIVWIASAMLGSAGGRLILPQSQAGMLEVRRRLIDVVVLAGFGVAMLALVASIKAR